MRNIFILINKRHSNFDNAVLFVRDVLSNPRLRREVAENKDISRFESWEIDSNED